MKSEEEIKEMIISCNNMVFTCFGEDALKAYSWLKALEWVLSDD